MQSYDIFISYRREDGAQYARILQLELEKRGFHVFLDYEELIDGVFGDEIKDAIRQAPIFIMVLTPQYLARSMESDSWVRQEIMLAIQQQKHFIPLNPDSSFKGVPAGTPEEICKIVETHQHSEINFGQALGATVDLLVNNRILKTVKPRNTKQRRCMRRALFVLAVLLVVTAIGSFFYFQRKAERRALMVDVFEDTQLQPNWSDDISLRQLHAVHAIMSDMVAVEGGAYMMGAQPEADGSFDGDVCEELEVPASQQQVDDFWMSKYEVNNALWCDIMGGNYPNDEAQRPKTDVSFDDCEAFCQKLQELTGLEFAIPTEVEWEYAARGGNMPDETKFAGSNTPDSVAWYSKNSKGFAHDCDYSTSGLYCNSLDLCDMSGNVSEWCATDFAPYDTSLPSIDPDAKVIRGGNYLSEPYELTVYHRDPMNRQEYNATTGLRLVIRR